MYQVQSNHPLLSSEIFIQNTAARCVDAGQIASKYALNRERAGVLGGQASLSMTIYAVTVVLPSLEEAGFDSQPDEKYMNIYAGFPWHRNVDN